MENFGAKLAESRRSKNLTQEELANRLGVTPQALSKWEKGLSSPDISMICAICGVLDISADYLLGTGNGKITEDGNGGKWEEICQLFRESQWPLKIILGKEVVSAFVEDTSYAEKVFLLRQNFAREGIIVPIVRIMDQQCIGPKEFYILVHENVLYKENLSEIGEHTIGHIVEKLEETVRARYIEILDADIVKCMVDNLRTMYPALITSIVPEKISYGLLLDVCRKVLCRGNSMLYLSKIIEVMERELRENPGSSIEILAEAASKEIERPDNFWVQLKH